MELIYTIHAMSMMDDREIPPEWVERVLLHPALRIEDKEDPEVEKFFGRVPEFGNRALRVVVNTHATPWRVVSVYFDRGMARSL